jgi:hypothetical protein
MVRLDNYADKHSHPAPHLIKVDFEGLEPSGAAGCRA